MFKAEYWHKNRLIWLLSIAAGLAALNIFSPTESAMVQASSERPPQTAAVGEKTTIAEPLPHRPTLLPAQKDPFASAHKQVTVAMPPLTTQIPIQVPTPQPVSAPILNIQFAGRITDPNGKQQLYVTLGETSMSIEQGTILPNGYRVENITADSIELNYLALDSKTRLPIPPTPRFETR